MTDEQQQYQYALDIFNQTVANMSSFVDAARADAINELNGLHAGYTDPVDDRSLQPDHVRHGPDQRGHGPCI